MPSSRRGAGLAGAAAPLDLTAPRLETAPGGGVAATGASDFDTGGESSPGASLGATAFGACLAGSGADSVASVSAASLSVAGFSAAGLSATGLSLAALSGAGVSAAGSATGSCSLDLGAADSGVSAFFATFFLVALGSSGCSSRIKPSRSALRRTRSAWASSMLDECVLTAMPSATHRSSVSLFVRPSSFASSWTRIFAANVCSPALLFWSWWHARMTERGLTVSHRDLSRHEVGCRNP